jgi:hypothetical protein
MKKILLLFLLSSQFSFSQSHKTIYYGSGGFGLIFPNTDELNSIIDYYNQSKPNLIRKLNHFGTFYGPNFSFGVIFNNDKSFINLEFGFAIIFSNTKSSKFIQTNNTRSLQDLQIRFPMLNFGIQYFIKTGKSFDVGAGCTMNLGSLNIFSRNYNNGANPPYFGEISNNTILSDFGITPTLFLNFNFSKEITLSLRPNYYLMLTQQNLTYFNNVLNPNTTINGITDASYSGPGVILNLLVKLNR